MFFTYIGSECPKIFGMCVNPNDSSLVNDKRWSISFLFVRLKVKIYSKHFVGIGLFDLLSILF